MKLLIVVGLVCVIGVVAIGAVTAAFGRFRQARSRSQLIGSLDRIVLTDDAADSFGIESLGRKQVRGGGTLVLTTSEFVFEQWVPKRVLRVPLGRITSVDTAHSFLGKTRGRRLLRVAWTTTEGGSDRAAWRVADLDAWLRFLPET